MMIQHGYVRVKAPLCRAAWLGWLAVAAGMEKKKQVLEHTIPLTGLSLAAGWMQFDGYA